MAVFDHLRLVTLAVLMLASQLDFASAAVRVFGLHANSLTGDPFGNDPDPYVKVWCDSASGGETVFRLDTASPSWTEEFYFPHCQANDFLKLEVWDRDWSYDDHLGVCERRVQHGLFIKTCDLETGVLYYTVETKI